MVKTFDEKLQEERVKIVSDAEVSLPFPINTEQELRRAFIALYHVANQMAADIEDIKAKVEKSP